MADDQINEADFSISLDDSIYETQIIHTPDDHRIVHSLTTDTLDSVALGPSPSEENLQRLNDAGIFDIETDDIDGHTPIGEVNEFLTHPTSITTGLPLQEAGLIRQDVEQDTESSRQDTKLTGQDGEMADTDNIPSLRSYFLSTPVVSSNNFFDDVPTYDKQAKTSGEDNSSIGIENQNLCDNFLSQNNDFEALSSLEKTLEEDIKYEKPLEEEDDIEHECHRQIRTVSDTEVVDFSCVENTERSSHVEATQHRDIPADKGDFEHFTAEGDENEGLENLSISPRLNVFIPPPPRSRTSSECSSPLTAGPLHANHSVPQSPAHSVFLHKNKASQEPSNSVTTPFVSTNESSINSDPLSFIVFNDDVSRSNAELDPFTASIQLSNKQRQYDAWLPSEATRQTLIAVVSSLPGPYTVPQDQLCFPTVALSEPQSDPIRELLDKYLGEVEASKRDVLTIDSVSHDEKGLGQLIEAGCFWAAVDLSARLLTAAGQGVESSSDTYRHSPSSLQLWLCRFTLHMRLNMYALADTEMKGFHNLDTPDLYYEYYPTVYPGHRGSMVPFALRLIHAELPHYLGRTQEALDHLYYILSVVRAILTNLSSGKAEDGSEVNITPASRHASLDLWGRREIKTLYIIGNTLLAIKDYSAAISVYSELIDKDTGKDSDLHSGIGRIYLQMGNVSMAKESFEKAAMVKTSSTGTFNNLVNQGLVCMCEARYPDAWQLFSQAIAMNPLNVVAINNLAVCALYMGRLKEALTSLENLIHQDPEKNLHEGILFNLCTLYELESSRAMTKKQALLQLVSRYKGDGFPVTCLKMA